MKNKFYRTQNLYEASYLLAKGFSLEGKEKFGKKMILLFRDSEEIKEESLKFYNGGMIEARAFSDSYRRLKDYVFER